MHIKTTPCRPQSEVAPLLEQMAWATYALSANRISHVLGLIGSSVAMDTASSSSLTAACLAARDMRQPASAGARAVAGGVNLTLHPNLTHLHTARKLFPKDGRCKTFDAAADGFERGEGAGAVVLRPLAAAAEAGDSVIALLCGVAAVHKGGGGKGQGFFGKTND